MAIERETVSKGRHVGVALIRSSHPNWAQLEAALKERPTIHLVGQAERANEAVALAERLHPEAVILAAEVLDRPRLTVIKDLCAVNPDGKIVVIGDKEMLDLDTLLTLNDLRVPSWFAWDDLVFEAVPDCLVALLQADILVGSRTVLEVLLASVDRRGCPRVDGLVLRPEERAALRAAKREITTGAVLWEENSDLTDILQTVFGVAEIGLRVVSTEEALLGAATQSRPGDFLIIDCARSLPDDIARCVAVVTQTDVPVYIIHPRWDIVDDLEPFARSDLHWISPELAGLRLLEKLRLLTAAPPPLPRTPLPRFSAREWELLRLVAEGYSDREIADEQGIGERTVKHHVRRLKAVAGVTNRQELRQLRRRMTKE